MNEDSINPISVTSPSPATQVNRPYPQPIPANRLARNSQIFPFIVILTLLFDFYL